MSMRSKTTLLIILIVFAATAVNFFSGMYFTNDSLEKTLEQDLAFAISIADSLIETQMKLMKAEAASIARLLASAASEDELKKLIVEQFDGSPDISALSVFDRSGVIAGYSVPPHEHDVSEHKEYFEMVYGGQTIITSPFYCSAHGEFVMNIYTPMGPARDKILSVTAPGLTFVNLLSKHRLWKTGDIFMLNEEGTFIGGADRRVVLAMQNYMSGAGARRQSDAGLGALIHKILSSDGGVAEYSFEGRQRMCAYSRIDESEVGWRVAVTVPFDESPQAEALNSYIYSALFCLIAGICSAFFLARLTALPYKNIEDQKRDLEKLNHTIRQQAAALLEEHERVKVMLDSTPLASRLWNKDFELIACNDAAVKLFNLKDKQEYMERYFELAPEHQPDGEPTIEMVMRSIAEAFEKGRCFYEMTYRTLDGTLVPTENTLVRVPYIDGEVVAAYSRDLRDQKKMLAEIEQHTRSLQETSEKLRNALADAEEANAAKSTFLAQMSHEIRTPLNAVIGLSKLTIDAGNLSLEAEENLDKIYGAGSTILSIVNDILDISKIESGKLELYPDQYDTPSLINDVVMLNIVRIGDKPITFKLSADENLPGLLYGDELRVKQVFNNLLSNAFKYTHAGTVEWRVSFEKDGDSVWLVSSVSDTGIGIKPEDLKKLFSDYNQVDVKTNRRVDGTGLGLAISKRLVEMMDGAITVESEYGEGSVFTVRMRQAFVSDAPIGKELAENLANLRNTLLKRSRDTRLTHANLSYANVLVVDDISTNLDVVKGMMKPYGMKVDCASSGPQAIEMIRAESTRYSAVFMDHMMPGMDGVEATRIIREEIGTDYARNVPIIALTANAILGNEKMFLNSGFQDFISKPIEIAKLDALLRRWVRNKNLEKADAPAPAETPRPKSMPSVKGVDVKKALERFSGDSAVLADVMRSYAGNTRPLLSHLKEYLAAGNLGDYAIVVHGIKGSSYGIVAQEAGKAAEALEAAAKAGDLEAVRVGHPAFEEIAEALLNGLDKALNKIDASIEKPAAEEPDPALLQELREACEAFYMDKVDAVMERLEAFQYDRGEQFVAWLREQVGHMAFEKISGLDLSALRYEDYEEGEELAKEYINITAPDAEILIVDDNETNLQAALGLLKPMRMRMDTAENGKAALDMIREKQYHLVLMDHMMPVMDGIEAAANLRRMEGEYFRNLPVIALTADAAPYEELKEKFLQAGMNDCVRKPIDMNEIREKIRLWLPAELLREQADVPKETETGRELPVIEGIDNEEGIRYLGTKELFVSLLGNFYKLIDLKAAKIERCLADGMIRDVTIEVHALKNTARMIGAKELSEGFSRLEQLGNDGDREAMERETPEVLRQYRAFKPRLKSFGEAAEQEKRPASGKELISLLRELKASMDGFDLDGADAALKRLEELRIPDGCRGHMETLRAYVADVAMEETMKLAETMIGIIEQIPEGTL